MSSNILPGRFDNGDFECWLREFDACCDANGWKVAGERDDKILKLPAFQFGIKLPVIFMQFQPNDVRNTKMPSLN